MLNLNEKLALPNKKEFAFFRQNNLSNWSLEAYVEHCQASSRVPLKLEKLSSQYKLFLNNIQHYVQDDDVKHYVNSLAEVANDKATEDQLHTTINNFHNVNYGTTAVMEAHGEVKVTQGSKKRKIADNPPTSGLSLSPERYVPQPYDSWEDTSEEEIVVEENVEMNVWDVWKEILETMQNDGNIDKYSLEHLNIVQLGNKHGSKITREYYPKELIKKTGLTYEEIPCSFVKDEEFYNGVFDIIVLSDELSSNTILTEAALLALKSKNPFMTFFVTVLQSFINGLFNEDSDVYVNEISYNHFILWPILTSLSKSIITTKFLLGEKKLEAVSQELKLMNDNRHFYNADGIILNLKSKIEIAILETTGPFHQQNDPKETQDYIKAGYGLVAMLHVIGRKFHYGEFDIFKKIGSFFIQATPTKIRIWRLSMPASKIYITNCIGSVEVPVQAKTCEEKLRKLIDLFWLLRLLIKESYQAMDELEESHARNIKVKARKLEGYDKVTSLCDNFKINTLVKLPQIYIKKSGHMQINSADDTN